MSKRPKLSEAVAAFEKLYGRPRTAEHADAPLLDHLLVGVLSLWVDRERAARATRVLSESFLDLNEARVSPLAELRAVLEPSLGAKSVEAAYAVRIALQDVYDGTHGLDLEPLRGREPDDLKKFLKELPHTMGGPAASIFQLALGEAHLALMAPEARVLDRLGLLPKTATPQKARVALEKQVKAADRLMFVWSIGSHAQAVCKAKDPLCESCTVLAVCRFGQEEVKRRIADRKKDELRRQAEEKRRLENEAKAARIAARAHAADAKKRAVHDAKLAKIASIAAKKVAEKVALIAKKRAAEDAKKAAAVAAKKAIADGKKAAIVAAKKAAADAKKKAAKSAKK